MVAGNARQRYFLRRSQRAPPSTSWEIPTAGPPTFRESPESANAAERNHLPADVLPFCRIPIGGPKSPTKAVEHLTETLQEDACIDGARTGIEGGSAFFRAIFQPP